VFIPFGLLLPYRRFRDTHLQHHYNPKLTDPYDDPESNFLDPAVWNKMSKPLRALLVMNNTLAGRMLFGPAIALFVFYKSDIKAIAKGGRNIAVAYGLHFIGMVPLIWWLNSYSSIPFWAYFLAAYGALSLLKVRTFLEHRAHDKVSARSVIIEGGGFFAFLFLNNNYHMVHHSCHSCPKVAWYQLPDLFERRRNDFLCLNRQYFYSSYTEIFRKYFFRTKDGVPHPFWPMPGSEQDSNDG